MRMKIVVGGRYTYVGKKLVTDPEATIQKTQTIKMYVFGSAKASFNPIIIFSCPLPSQSFSPISASNLQVAKSLSISVNHEVLLGKSGKMKKAAAAITTVIAPSMMKSQRHAKIPALPSIPLVIPAAIKPEKAPEIREPE